MRALPALRITVSPEPLGGRNENWKSFQSSWNTAPLKRSVPFAQVVFQPSS